ncbi:MAG TPA: amidohydrolase family protein [Opitutaceae bacterium]|nr:amidohydrolase family protein [Opitutaceae bacterium]
MAAPAKPMVRKPPSRPVEPPAAPAAAPRPSVSAPKEMGWLPDLVYTGDKFESGLAFFADALGRITRFSREPADLASARRLAGQAALPGLVNGHSISWQRLLRGRMEPRVRMRVDPRSAWGEGRDRLAARLTPDDVFETARMAFTEMLLSGITCVGEFHELLNRNDGGSWTETRETAHAILRAAHDVGIRIALFPVATLRAGHGAAAGSAAPACGSASVEAYLRAAESLRTELTAQYPSDEAWMGVAPASLAAVPLDAFKAIAGYAHAQRLRLQTRVGESPDDAEACLAEHGRPAIAVLSEQGVVDKRFTAVHGIHLTPEECRILGTARAVVCACPTAEHSLALGAAPVFTLLEAGGAVALGSGSSVQIDLLKDARLLEYDLRGQRQPRPEPAVDAAALWFHAATVAGARSLGATGGALEVGRPADFFTVNLYDPSIAGADPGSLLPHVVFAVERRAIREVWVGARQQVSNARHANQGLIVGRFVELQRRLW